MRPPSHKSVLKTKEVQGTNFCERIVMEPLSLLPRDDSIRGTPPSEASRLYTKLTSRINYIRGHMLNEHLHGPGTNNNIVPISNAFNSRMKVTVEQATKDAVNANNKVVRFEAEAKEWGSYQGLYKGAFPDETLLPAKFKFDVRQMKLKPDRTGRSTDDWYVTGIVIYSQELQHDPPSAADARKGTVAPVERAFEPGYYRSVKDQYKKVAADTYHLDGAYMVNGPSYAWLFQPLGLDPKALKSDRLELPVTTVFKVPTGYELVPVPEEEIEIIHDKAIMKKHTPSGSSFLIVKRAEWMKNLEIFREELRKVKAEEPSGKGTAEKAAGSATRTVIASAADARKAENARHQLTLEANVRLEAQKLRSPLDEECRQKFAVILGKVIEQAKTDWGKNEQLGSRNAHDLQKPYLAILAEQRDVLLQGQMQKTAPVKMEAFIPGLIGALQNRIRELLAGLGDPAQGGIFRAEAEKILAFYRNYWTDPKQRFDIKRREELLASAYRHLDAARQRAQAPIASTQAPQSPKRKREDTVVNKRDTDEEEEEEPQEKERDQKRLRPAPGPFRLPADIAGSASRQQDTPRFQPRKPTHSSPPVQDPGVRAKEIAGKLWGEIAGWRWAYQHDDGIQDRLARLAGPMKGFIEGPTDRGWWEVSSILNELQQVDILRKAAANWIVAWNSIAPRRNDLHQP